MCASVCIADIRLLICKERTLENHQGHLSVHHTLIGGPSRDPKSQMGKMLIPHLSPKATQSNDTFSGVTFL